MRAVGQKAGRQVDGNDFRTWKILAEAIDDIAEESPHRFRQSCTQHRINDDVGIQKFDLFFVPFLRVGDHRWRISDRFQDFEVRLCITGNILFPSEKKDQWISPLLNQLTRHNKTVAAIVPFSAKYSDCQVFEFLESLLQCFNNPHAGIFHKQNARNTELLRRQPVYLANLLRSQDFHNGFEDMPLLSADATEPCRMSVIVDELPEPRCQIWSL